MEFPLFLNEGKESARDSAFEATKEARALRVVCPPPTFLWLGKGWGTWFQPFGKLVRGGAGLAEEGGWYPPSLRRWKGGGAQKASHRRGERKKGKDRPGTHGKKMEEEEEGKGERIYDFLTVTFMNL